MTTATLPQPITRDEAITAIRTGLRARSDRTWTVRAGRGTSWGWLTITAPPARCTKYGQMSADDRAELARLLGLPAGRVHEQGVMIEPGSAAYREYVARAQGRHAAASGDGRQRVEAALRDAGYVQTGSDERVPGGLTAWGRNGMAEHAQTDDEEAFVCGRTYRYADGVDVVLAAVGGSR